MSSPAELLSMYDQWETLTREEGRAIGSSDWLGVSQLQGEKRSLQVRIVETSDRLQTQIGLGSPQWQAVEQTLRAMVERLILLETRNGEILAAKRSAAELEREELARSGQNLRRVHRAYSSQAQASWNSYS